MQGFELRSRTAPSPDGWDAARTARLGGFGLFLYGPLMHFWYGALNSALPVDRAWPLAAKLPPFLAKARPTRACASVCERKPCARYGHHDVRSATC